MRRRRKLVAKVTFGFVVFVTTARCTFSDFCWNACFVNSHFCHFVIANFDIFYVLGQQKADHYWKVECKLYRIFSKLKKKKSILKVWWAIVLRSIKGVWRERGGNWFKWKSRGDEWTGVGEKPSQCKRKEKADSSEGRTETEEENKREAIPNIVIWFGGEKLIPLKLTEIICVSKGYVRVLRDGNLLIWCSSDEQIAKATNLIM